MIRTIFHPYRLSSHSPRHCPRWTPCMQNKQTRQQHERYTPPESPFEYKCEVCNIKHDDSPDVEAIRPRLDPIPTNSRAWELELTETWVQRHRSCQQDRHGEGSGDSSFDDLIHTVHWHAIDFTQECGIFPENVEVVMSASRNGPPYSY